MVAQLRLIYASSNGDRWLLVAEPHSEKRVRHEPNRSSGGITTELGIDEFLASGHGPQHEALRAMLAEEKLAMKDGGAGLPFSTAQIRAGRAMLGWSQEHLAQEANLELDQIIACESSSTTHPPPHLIARAANALERAGVVLFGEGEVTAGGPGVRMGSLGTSTGKPLSTGQSDANDNQPKVDPRQSRSAAN